MALQKVIGCILEEANIALVTDSRITYVVRCGKVCGVGGAVITCQP